MAAISRHFANDVFKLTHKHLEMYEFMLNTMATDTLVLKHQAISIHNAD